jgi:hypothetical protein
VPDPLTPTVRPRRSLWSHLLEWVGISSRQDADDVRDDLERIFTIMGVREDAADQRQADLITEIRNGVTTQASVIAGLVADKEALTAERDTLRTALEQADATKAEEINAAVLVDRELQSDADAAAQERLNDQLAEVSGIVNPGPVDGGGDSSAGDGESPGQPVNDAPSSDAQPSS